MEARITALERMFHGHEAVCTERWTTARKATDELKTAVEKNAVEASAGRKAIHDKIDQLTSVVSLRMWATVIGLVSVLLAVIGYLIHILISGAAS